MAVCVHASQDAKQPLTLDVKMYFPSTFIFLIYMSLIQNVSEVSEDLCGSYHVLSSDCTLIIM